MRLLRNVWIAVVLAACSIVTKRRWIQSKESLSIACPHRVLFLTNSSLQFRYPLLKIGSRYLGKQLGRYTRRDRFCGSLRAAALSNTKDSFSSAAGYFLVNDIVVRIGSSLLKQLHSFLSKPLRLKTVLNSARCLYIPRAHLPNLQVILQRNQVGHRIPIR